MCTRARAVDSAAMGTLRAGAVFVVVGFAVSVCALLTSTTVDGTGLEGGVCVGAWCWLSFPAVPAARCKKPRRARTHVTSTKLNFSSCVGVCVRANRVVGIVESEKVQRANRLAICGAGIACTKIDALNSDKEGKRVLQFNNSTYSQSAWMA